MNRQQFRELKRVYDNPQKFLSWLDQHDLRLKYYYEKICDEKVARMIDTLMVISAYTLRYKLDLDRDTLPEIMFYIMDNIDSIDKKYLSIQDCENELKEYGIELKKSFKEEIGKLKTQEQNYLDYINEHINNVQIAWGTMKIKLDDFLPTNVKMDVDKLVNEHDRSKFSPEEFDGYRQWYYPYKDEEKDAEMYNKAWIHHYTNNPHHWQYWKDKEGIELEQKIPYILEMIADWTAMGYKFNDTPQQYYEKEKNNIILTDDAREYLEDILKRLED